MNRILSRRLRWIAALCFTTLTTAFTHGHAQTQTPLVTAVDSVGYTVGDMDAVLEFFTTVLAFEKVSDDEIIGDDFEALLGVFGLRARVVKLELGTETATLTQFLAPRGRPIPVDSRSNDGWFQHMAIVVSDMDAAYKRLRNHKVEHASAGPQTLPDWNPSAGGIKAFYFKDPEGHVLELLEFPKGKGVDRWQKKDRLFLGIDHTAIVVEDTDRALRFYRDLLDMKVVGNSENYGREQERLNNVFGARLRITSLRTGKGPGIELLEYLSPSTGKPYPNNTKANDLWHWQTQLRVVDVHRAAKKTRESHVDWISPGVIDIEDDELAIDAGLMVIDPFGHRMLLVEPKK